MGKLVFVRLYNVASKSIHTMTVCHTNTVCVGLTGRMIGFNMKGKKRREYHWLKLNTGISHNLEETWRRDGEKRK